MPLPMLMLPVLATVLLAAPGHAGPRPKVLVIGIDGLRPEGLRAAETPHIDRLAADGAWSWSARTDAYTVSGPGWSSLLTGTWSSRHGVIDNSFDGRRYDAHPHFFTRVKQADPDLVTASFLNWLPLDRFLVTGARCDIHFAHDYADAGDVRMLAAARCVLREQDPDVTFFYLADVDIAGHDFGFHPASPEYLAEIEQADTMIGLLLDAVRARPTYAEEDWLILLSTDHGGTLDGAHGRDEPKHRRIPYIASGPSAARGEILPAPANVDIPVTAMAHLGITPDPAWRLDGVVSGLPRPARLGENLIRNGDAEANAGCTGEVVNLGVPGWDDLGGMTVIAYSGVESYPDARTPGPADRGHNFFSGSGEGDCRMEQVIGVEPFARDIDAGRIRFTVSGWLGGYADQRDLASVTAVFLDEHGGERGRATIGPVTLQDRRAASDSEDLTALLHREITGPVPRSTRRIRFILESEVGGGANDGYADGLALVLHD